MEPEQRIAGILGKHLPSTPRTIPYGTAGFRARADFLQHVVVRSSLLAVLRSYSTRKAIGICITASHNPAEDNGVKLIDPEGGMLSAEFEKHATELSNAEAAGTDPLTVFRSIATAVGADLSDPKVFSGCLVLLGRDTRDSSPVLAKTVIEGVGACSARIEDYGLVTTPQLHHMVRVTNEIGALHPPPLEKYFAHYIANLAAFSSSVTLKTQGGDDRLVCDAANGVGALHVGHFKAPLKELLGVRLEVRNDGKARGAVLNFEAGAEHVQKTKSFPLNFESDRAWTRCCAFDGDADRLVYFSSNERKEVVLFDGDKIGALYARVIIKLILALCKAFPKTADTPLSFGVVQTAYANGASTLFFETLEQFLRKIATEVTLKVACVKTGVKNLHHKALEFDIAIYFESNGHGTVIFKRERLAEWAASKEIPPEAPEYSQLLSFLEIFNSTTGDAMTDMLAVEAGLAYIGLSPSDWAHLYVDLPCQQRKVRAERIALDQLKPHPVHEKSLVEPIELQEAIDAVVQKYPGGRAFARPSGTEDCCRLYAEAATLEDAEALGSGVESVLIDFFSRVRP